MCTSKSLGANIWAIQLCINFCNIHDSSRTENKVGGKKMDGWMEETGSGKVGESALEPGMPQLCYISHYQ